ncbi:hypothetical protein AAFF_G00361570 [Aldrovandia affinis]|uniref:Uncharacterized protein n=1 Tax=Aldrovandia affinis TaxID=143900 RepID=A0AAD7SIB9_9TELE|nr:hypothetical protein AAFF_G00361570 [Aldrovandia affinis]
MRVSPTTRPHSPPAHPRPAAVVSAAACVGGGHWVLFWWLPGRCPRALRLTFCWLSAVLFGPTHPGLSCICSEGGHRFGWWQMANLQASTGPTPAHFPTFLPRPIR